MSAFEDPLTLVEEQLSSLRQSQSLNESAVEHLELEKAQILHALKIGHTMLQKKRELIIRRKHDLNIFDSSITQMDNAFNGIVSTVGHIVDLSQKVQERAGDDWDSEEEGDRENAYDSGDNDESYDGEIHDIKKEREMIKLSSPNTTQQSYNLRGHDNQP
jgi:hypothetical protein